LTHALPLGAQEFGVAPCMLPMLLFRPAGIMDGHQIPAFRTRPRSPLF